MDTHWQLFYQICVDIYDKDLETIVENDKEVKITASEDSTKGIQSGLLTIEALSRAI